MRWDRLFADLQAQAEEEERAQLAAEVGERTRFETGRLRLADRLAAQPGADLRVFLPGAGAVAGRLAGSGADWLLLELAPAGEALVPTAAVLSVSGLGRAAREPASAGPLAERMDLRRVLRGLVRDRAQVALTLRDGSGLRGRLDLLGADFVELRDEDGRALTVPLAALALVRNP